MTAPKDNRNAAKGAENRVMWSGRLPVPTVAKLRRLAVPPRSQADVVAEAVDKIPDAPRRGRR